MSRCFPFPPPGYEKKIRPDDENLLEKEKRKEKNHKEKKDKSKKDKKEKKDREGKQKGKESGEDKRRERKDRKERHKHKKNKNKEKEKNRPSEDKITAGPPECSTVDNPGSSCTQSDETSDIKFLVELGKRTRGDDKATENLLVKKINLTGKICCESVEKVGLGKNGNSHGNAMLTEKRTNDRKFCGQTNNADARGTENGTVQNFVAGQQTKVEGVAGLVGKNVEKRMVPNKIDEHNSSESRVDRGNDRDREGKSKSSKERRSEKELNKEQLQIARENSRHAVFNDSNTGFSPLPNESNKNSNLGKRKELRINGFLHDDEIRPSKLQRPLSCSKEVVEDVKNLKPSKTLTKSVPELVGMVNNHKLNSKLSSSHLTTEDGSKFNATSSDIQFASVRQWTGDNHKVNNNVPSSLCTLDGRTLETLKAGSLLSSESCKSSINHKVDDKVGLAHPVLENRVVQKAATLAASGGPEEIGHSKVDIKEHKINGLVKDKKPNGSSTRPSSSAIEQSVGEYPKPPHPDSKYLSKILAIPSIEWPGFDGQEWLLGSNSLHKRNEANSSSSQFEETKQVWDKALRLESADITAMPYVIPY